MNCIYAVIKNWERCYILQFKFKEKRWVIDATEDNKSFG